MSTTYLIANITPEDLAKILTENSWSFSDDKVLFDGENYVHISFVGANMELTRYGANDPSGFLDVFAEDYSVWCEY